MTTWFGLALIIIIVLLGLILFELNRVTKYLTGDFKKVDWLVTDEPDEMIDAAVKVIADYNNASASLIQRKLDIGYARSARILEQLHRKGLISDANGAKPRKVYKDKVKDYLSAK